MGNHKKQGSFTMPTEIGYEALTLALAETWGADAVRDCDGARLPSQILDTGMDVYATICIIREHNEFSPPIPTFSNRPSSRQTVCCDGRRDHLAACGIQYRPV